jgi:hypothetical protein
MPTFGMISLLGVILRTCITELWGSRSVADSTAEPCQTDWFLPMS